MNVSVFGYMCTYVGITWDVISFNLITVLGYAVLLPVLDHLVICVVTDGLSYLCCLLYNISSLIVICDLDGHGGV
jgi:hypothetical protein